MAKIADYPKTTSLRKDDVFLIDGVNGTKTILAEVLSRELFFMSMDSDPSTDYSLRRMLWRGKNLGTRVTTEQFARIKDGTFTGLWVGDYWDIGGRVYRIMDFNYWLGKGDGDLWCTTNHLVIVPDHILYNQRMNATNTTDTGYATSEMRTSGLSSARNTVNNAFGTAHVLTYRGYFTNAVSTGVITGGSWYDATVELPSEIMVYGTKNLGTMNSNNVFTRNNTIDTTQLAGFQAKPYMIVPHRESYWLTDICYSTYFASVSGGGGAHCNSASGAIGVRPVFGLVG